MAQLQMPDELSRLIQDYCRPAWQHPNKEHKYLMNIMVQEIAYINENFQEMLDEGFEMEEENFTWSDAGMLLGMLGYHQGGVIVDGIRQIKLNWAFNNYGSPFKEYQ